MATMNPPNFSDPCFIGIDYDEFKPESYRLVHIEVPGESAAVTFASGNAEADLAEALRWFAREQPTQMLAFRSSVTHFQQDARRR